MNRKRNVAFIKPEDPNFLKVLKKQVGYDDSNHKFDKLEQDDFVDDEESELPQVVVLKEGDLTAEEANEEKLKIEKAESTEKADLSQKVIFQSKTKKTSTSKKNTSSDKDKSKNLQLLSFGDDESEDET
ncbi:uncharacterized protein KIAA1143 homolog [Aricia agestis]|uniref:uncharacterized protein KIAA1143 homolog n=1 Tax=Aricia agestis TaxID=91739 RepID=UPI001C207B9B|nr:uncharacterized protein KIAA1143 homolog [Aricia agestis]